MTDLLGMIADVWNKILNIMNNFYIIDTPMYKLSLLKFDIAIFIVGLICTIVFNIVRYEKHYSDSRESRERKMTKQKTNFRKEDNG